jgi:hypothetical protein
MNRKVQVYIEGQRLELFNDEQIQVTSTQQNVADISKTYTDFSQSFTIPASPYNNAILQHFYQSDVNATIDHNIRRNAFIEIDLTFFRRGKIQVEKAQLKNGQAESYTLSFFGEGKTLLDYFGEDLLSDLDYISLNHTYTGAEVKSRIIDGTNAYHVKYPLISSKRIWTWTGQAPTTITPSWLTIPTSGSNDIHHTSGHIHYNELFPAVRVSKIFGQIADKYGVTFNGNFLADDRFTKLFLWYKNRNEFNFFSEAQVIDFQNISSNLIGGLNPYNPSLNISLANNTITVQNLQDVTNYQIRINILSSSASVGCMLDVYQNGNLFQSIPFIGVGTLPSIGILNTAGLNAVYTFEIRSNAVVTIDSEIKFDITTLIDDPSTGAPTLNTNYAIVQMFANTLTVNTDLATLAPVMKVSEFFSGILKVFNMTCYGITDNSFQVEPLDDWYSAGAIVDISRFVDVDTIDVDRMKLYKKITMKYQDSESFLNKQFSQLFMREYGNTTYQYSYDGDEFTLDVPFENLLQTKFTGTNLQVGYSLNNEFAPYVPKPILLYQYDNKDVDFHFNNGTTTSNITNYTPFGQDLYTNLTDYTLNFAPDISTILNQPVQQTLFGTYYFSYLYNLYNLKQRLISVKTILPIGLLTGLKLNDRLVIRDKRYIINSMQSNLTTGEVNFQLILDFRPMVNATQIPSVGIAGGNVLVPIDFVNDTYSALITCTDTDVTISPSEIFAPQFVTVTIPAGSSGTVYAITVRYILNSGVTETRTINIIQR